MIRIDTVEELRRQVRAWRAGRERIAFVPTMGNLHAGHIRLVEEARALADHVVVSIFVNPMQFGPGEDFDRYPRTIEVDCDRLAAAEADLLFAPSVAEVYPRPQAEQTRIEVPCLSTILCGASRPGHFTGVATVVCKLLNMVQPDLALFGEKDYQQLMVIRRMVEDLALPVEIHGVAIVREADGLAMSSRNGYLSPAEREIAPALQRGLQWVATELRRGRDDFGVVAASAREQIREAGMRPDYLEIRRAQDLAEAGPGEPHLAVLAAAYLGTTRLIDNLILDRD